MNYEQGRAVGGTNSASVVCLGELLIDFAPDSSSPHDHSAAGNSAHQGAAPEDDANRVSPAPDRFVSAAGGAPANVAVALTKLGVASAFLGAVGRDHFGDFLTATLRANGVELSGLVEVEQLTALAFVTLGAGGERDFIFYRNDAAHDRLEPADVEAAFASRAFASSRVLHLGSNSFAVEPLATAAWRAVELATGRGLAVSFDVNYRAAFWPDSATAITAIRALLPVAEIVKLSQEELLLLTGDDSQGAAEEFATDLLRQQARLVCVTLGERGALYYTRSGTGEMRAPAVASSDTTGAGDAFAAGILVAEVADPATWTDNEATRRAVARACAYAAMSTTRRGAIPSYGDLAALERFLTEVGSAW